MDQAKVAQYHIVYESGVKPVGSHARSQHDIALTSSRFQTRVPTYDASGRLAVCASGMNEALTGNAKQSGSVERRTLPRGIENRYRTCIRLSL